MKYLLLYGDENGETHFKDMEMDMKLEDFAPPAPKIETSEATSATGFVSIGFPPGWVGDFHPAPKKQWMIFLAGSLEIGASDGEKHVLSTGTIALVDEAGSKGHTTKVVGDEHCYMAVVQIN